MKSCTTRGMPPAQILYLGNFFLSKTKTSNPLEARYQAQVEPAGPAPTIMTSYVFIFFTILAAQLRHSTYQPRSVTIYVSRVFFLLLASSAFLSLFKDDILYRNIFYQPDAAFGLVEIKSLCIHHMCFDR